MQDSYVVEVLVPVETELTLPLELSFVEDGVLDETVDDVSGVDVDDDQGVHLLSVTRVEVCPH